jgi:uncharacterized membrane protein
MKRALLFFAFTIFICSYASGASIEYDVIIVRSDLPYDWTVAQAFSKQAQIPIITTSPDFLDPSTAEQLEGFLESGHTSVLLFGGENAVSPKVEEELVKKGFVTHRIREVDRYGTSARVALELYETADSVVIVNGENVEALLNSQVAAFQTNSPILLVKKSEIPLSVKEALRILETKEVILIPSDLSENVESELKSTYEVSLFEDDFTAESDRTNFRMLDIAIGLFLGVLIAYLFRYKGKEKVPYNVLTEDEQRIICAIEENGGELGQDALYNATGFSRPKISRMVSELVERDLLEKTQFKRTFKLKIKKELVKD